jgi:hypothetical protein
MIKNIYPERDLDFSPIPDPDPQQCYVERQVVKAAAVPA